MTAFKKKRPVRPGASSEAFAIAQQSASLGAASLPAPGLLRRMAVWLYEGLLLFALMMVAVMLQSLLALAMLPVLNHPVLLQLMTLLLCGGYLVFFWSRSGQTLPMKTWHVCVVDVRTGRPPVRSRAAVRYVLACTAWGLPAFIQATPWRLPVAELGVLLAGWVVIWAILSRFHPQGQFWHDVLAGTRLVDTRQLPR